MIAFNCDFQFTWKLYFNEVYTETNIEIVLDAPVSNRKLPKYTSNAKSRCHETSQINIKI